jgi:hypothetical protein
MLKRRMVVIRITQFVILGRLFGRPFDDGDQWVVFMFGGQRADVASNIYEWAVARARRLGPDHTAAFRRRGGPWVGLSRTLVLQGFTSRVTAGFCDLGPWTDQAGHTVTPQEPSPSPAPTTETSSSQTYQPERHAPPTVCPYFTFTPAAAGYVLYSTKRTKRKELRPKWPGSDTKPAQHIKFHRYLHPPVPVQYPRSPYLMYIGTQVGKAGKQRHASSFERRHASSLSCPGTRDEPVEESDFAAGCKVTQLPPEPQLSCAGLVALRRRPILRPFKSLKPASPWRVPHVFASRRTSSLPGTMSGSQLSVPVGIVGSIGSFRFVSSSRDFCLMIGAWDRLCSTKKGKRETKILRVFHQFFAR